MFRRAVAYLTLLVSFSLTWMAARLAGAVRRQGRRPGRRIAVTGTFYNRGWFLSHAIPLSRSGVDEVIFVADEPQEGLPGVRFVCPPRWVSRLLGRALAKLAWMILVGVRYQPGLYMGFHLFPGAMSTLIVARLFGRPACYQMTGGPVEVIGGGAHNENRLMSGLGRPSPFLERLAMAVVRQFDLIVVRGRRAKRFLADRGLDGRVEVVTGSIASGPAGIDGKRSVDLIFVGRLTAIKQPEQFVRIVAAVAREIPSVRAVMVGGGPELPRLEALARELGIAEQVRFLGQRDDVPDLLEQAKVFVLTSRSEGLSIAMAEAMSRGLPAVAADVGELGDLVADGVNGWLIPPGDLEQYARRIVELLSDQDQWRRCSRAAATAAVELAGVENVAGRWHRCLSRLMDVGPVASS